MACNAFVDGKGERDLHQEDYPEIILASASPRRKELLEKTDLLFEIDFPQINEEVTGTPEECVKEIATRKAMKVKEQHPRALIIAADTLVESDGEILGKPITSQKALEMLKKLSGKWHHVYTGVCVLDGRTGKVHMGVEKTDVLFSVLSDELIAAYIATGEPLDKAGAYGIQGAGEMFIEEIRGSYSNVMGLPLNLLRKMLLAFHVEALPRQLINTI
ncbi:MAG: septum formation inhibitor Maf [Clostridiales bacterium]|nr:septum formation inhibitor Maf [Clostridiales bacterium]